MSNWSTSPFFVEFIGPPGAGKSTVARRVCIGLREAGISTRSPVAAINNQLSPAIRPLAKLPYVTYGGLKTPTLLFEYARQSLPSEFNTPLLFNWLFVFGVTSWNRSQPGVTLYDQGMIQALWSFHLSERNHVVDFYRRKLLATYPESSTLLVRIEASSEVIYTRLRSRTINDSRVSPESSAEFTVRDAMRAYETVTETIRQLAEVRDQISVLTFQNNNSSDLEVNVQEIVGEVRSRI